MGKQKELFSSQQFELEVLETIRKYEMIHPGDRIVVGVSGGADSVCLLFLLKKLTAEWEPAVGIRAVHVHHGIRTSADRDSAYVEELCRSLSIPLQTERINVPKESERLGMSLEETGRVLRYQIFSEASQEWDEERMAEEQTFQDSQRSERDENPGLRGKSGKSGGKRKSGEEIKESGGIKHTGHARIAVAHHMEDRAETVLFNLCRGSSLSGMAGIRPCSNYKGTTIIRPLIESTRAGIESYLSEKGIEWREDETNGDISISRNFIRHRILPELNEHINSSAVPHIARVAEELEETEEYLRGETRKALGKVFDEQGHFYKIPELEKLPVLVQKRILYQALTEVSGHKKDITHRHIEELLKLIKVQGNGRLDLAYGVMARKEYGRLYIRKQTEDRKDRKKSEDQGRNSDSGGLNQQQAGDLRGMIYPTDAGQYSWRIFSRPPGSGETEWPDDSYTKWIDYDKINRSFLLRTRQPGDYIALDGKGNRKKLTRVMIDCHVPETVRSRIVLPMSGSRVIWFPGYRIGYDCRIDEETTQILEIRWNPQGCG